MSTSTSRSPRLNPRKRGLRVGSLPKDTKYGPVLAKLSELGPELKSFAILLQELLKFDDVRREFFEATGEAGTGHPQSHQVSRRVHRVVFISDPDPAVGNSFLKACRIEDRSLDSAHDADLVIVNDVVVKHRTGPVGLRIFPKKFMAKSRRKRVSKADNKESA